MELINILFLCIIIALVPCIMLCTCFYFSNKQYKERIEYINDAKNKLEKSGLKYNHSYKLIHKKNERISYLRIFGLKYCPDKKKVYANVYMTNKNGEIGTWYDDFNYLIDIDKRWNIIDCGEWNPNK